MEWLETQKYDLGYYRHLSNFIIYQTPLFFFLPGCMNEENEDQPDPHSFIHSFIQS